MTLVRALETAAPANAMAHELLVNARQDTDGLVCAESIMGGVEATLAPGPLPDEFDLDSHHVRLLTQACEPLDRSELARESLAKQGLTYTDRFGSLKARPECAIDRDNKISFARLIREIGLDVSPPAESRPTTLRGNR
jgi:hypothetical protein